MGGGGGVDLSMLGGLGRGGVGFGGDGDGGFRDDTALVAENYRRAMASQMPTLADNRPRDDTGRGGAPGDAGFRDDTGLVAHNMELARASQGQSGGMFGLDDRRNIVDQSGGATDQVLGAPPAYSEGGILGGYNSVFAPNAPPSGWFTMKDYYNQSPKGQANPGANTADAQMLSTNNWRLLPAQYRDPNYFMVNGQIIDRRLAQRQLAPASVMGLEGGTGAHGFTPTRGSDPGRWRTGHNVAGFGANEGYIGSLGGWGSVGGEVT